MRRRSAAPPLALTVAPLLLLLLVFAGPVLAAGPASTPTLKAPARARAASLVRRGEMLHRLAGRQADRAREPLSEAPHAGGAIVAPVPPERLRLPFRPGSIASLPPRVDLSDRLPPIDTQLATNSCGGWASSYYYKTAQELAERGWSLYDAGNQPRYDRIFSPNFVYNQAQAGCAGTRMADIFQVFLEVGSVPWATFPWDPNGSPAVNCQKAPDAAALAQAAEYKAQSYFLFWSSGTLPTNNSIDLLKEWLAYGDAAVLLVPISNEFDVHRCGAPVPAATTTSFPRGNHFVAVVGYDDGQQAFKIANSWGRGWGCDGFGMLSYDFVRRFCYQAAAMYDYLGAPEPGGGGGAPGGGATLAGTVLEGGRPAPNVVLRLRFWDGLRWTTAASATSDLNGRYTFADLPALSSGQEYYVRYGPNNADERRVFNWYTDSVTSLSASQSVILPAFDVADVNLIGPGELLPSPPPVTFYWDRRTATPQDHYFFTLFDPKDARVDLFGTDDLGPVDRYTLQALPEGASPGIEYGWDVFVENAAGIGQSFYYVPVTFPGSTTTAARAELVPIVLDVVAGTARYTTELSVTNRGSYDTKVELEYTGALGAAVSGHVQLDSLAGGQQVVLPDVLATLRALGLPIPPSSSGGQGGTLLVRPVDPLASLVATARTTTATAAPLPVGSAGLAYGSRPASSGAGQDRLVVYGLRSTTTDRSNLAIYNQGGAPVTFRATAFSGDGDRRQSVLLSDTQLAPYGFLQLNNVLAGPGYRSGWVVVERTSPSGDLGAYGVINDNVTNDGSFVPAVAPAASGSRLTVPVLVETAAFRSELALANRAAAEAVLTLSYVESLSPASGRGGGVTVRLAPGEQRIVPEAVDFLRRSGASIGPLGSGSYAGALRVSVSGVSLGDTFAGARTASVVPGGGQFGLFTPGVYAGEEAAGEAWIYGLRSDVNARTNVAVLNAGADGSGSVQLELQVLDGSTAGAEKGAPLVVSLAPGEWSQPAGFFAAAGAPNGYVRVRRLSGSAPWIAYGVVNDGGQPGQRTGDGAYVPADTTPVR